MEHSDDAPRLMAGQPISYSRVLHLDTRADMGKPTGDGMDMDAHMKKLMDLCKARAADPTIFEEFPPFFFGAEVSNSQWDAYDTRMAPSTLKNYAADCTDGVAFLRNHNSYSEDPVGHSLTGTFTGAQGNGVARTRAQFYMLTDPESQTYVNKIRSGVVRDVSVGFYSGRWVCSICGQDMQDWYSRDGCPHILGMTYTPKDEAGKQVGEPVVARATIEDAHMAEASGVFDGATPGAMIDKMRALADQMDTRTRDFVQVRYRIQLPGGSRIVAVPDMGRLAAQQEEGSMEPEARIKELDARVKELEGQLAAAQSSVRTVESIRSTLTPLMPADHPGKADSVAAVAWLVEERARLAPLADDGRAYRNDLIAGAITEGVRAHGADFAQETYKTVLEHSPLEVIKRMRDDWAAIAAKTFPQGRQTADEGKAETPTTTGNTRREPISAYRG